LVLEPLFSLQVVASDKAAIVWILEDGQKEIEVILFWLSK
jgi:hypothetical protein